MPVGLYCIYLYIEFRAVTITLFFLRSFKKKSLSTCRVLLKIAEMRFSEPVSEAYKSALRCLSLPLVCSLTHTVRVNQELREARMRIHVNFGS